MSAIFSTRGLSYSTSARHTGDSPSTKNPNFQVLYYVHDIGFALCLLQHGTLVLKTCGNFQKINRLYRISFKNQHFGGPGSDQTPDMLREQPCIHKEP